MGESTPPAAAGAGSAVAERDAARADIESVKGEIHEEGEAHPLLDHKHPQHGEAQARRRALYEKAYPGVVGPDGFFDPQAADALAAAMQPPARPEDYRLDLPPIPGFEGNDDDMQAVADVKAWAHQAGFSQVTLDELGGRFRELIADDARHDPETIAARQSRCVAALRAVWGDDFDTKFAAAMRAVERLGGERLAAFMDNTRLGDDPWVVRALAEAAERNGW